MLLSCLSTAMLDFESALARAEARVGVIPQAAADTITAAAKAENFDAAAIAREATPAIPQVRRLEERAGEFVHHGASNQDVCDTAMVLLLRRARPILAGYQRVLTGSLRRLANAHAQPAPSIAFGLKAAHWFAAVQASWRRFDARFGEALLLQVGGPRGTVAHSPRSHCGHRLPWARWRAIFLRPAGGWQAEWPIVSDAIQTIGAAIAAMAGVVEGLEVFPDRVHANLAAAA